VLTAVSVALGLVTSKHVREESPSVVKLFFPLPQETFEAARPPSTAVSPDGRRVAYQGVVNGRGEAVAIQDVPKHDKTGPLRLSLSEPSTLGHACGVLCVDDRATGRVSGGDPEFAHQAAQCVDARSPRRHPLVFLLLTAVGGSDHRRRPRGVHATKQAVRKTGTVHFAETRVAPLRKHNDLPHHTQFVVKRADVLVYPGLRERCPEPYLRRKLLGEAGTFLPFRREIAGMHVVVR